MSAEQNVLGAVLIDPSAYWRVADILRPEFFTEYVHDEIWRTYGRMHDEGKPIDVFTLADEGVCPANYAVDLQTQTPSAANIRAYAEIVVKAATRHRVQLAGERIAAQGDLEEAQSLLGAILDGQPGRLISAKDANEEMFRGVIERYNAAEDLSGLPTGIEALDDLTGGLQRKRVYAVGARAKMGKSVLAWQIAAHVAVHGKKRVTGFSLEMGTDELMQRMACCIGGVRSGGLLHPKLMDAEEWTKLNAAIRALNESRLLLCDRMDVTIDQIEAQVRQSKPDLVVIDYLQLIEQPKLETEAVRLAYITRRVKKLAKECDVPVIEVFQVNRGNESTGVVRPPRPSDARGSGTIEQDCDAMLLLHRDSYYDKAAQKGLRLDLALQRNGPTGIIHMDEELDRCRFGRSTQWHEPTKSNRGYDDL